MLPEQKKIAQYISWGEVKGTMLLLEDSPLDFRLSPHLDINAKMVVMEEIVLRLKPIAKEIVEKTE